ncbi:unnamed protein product [Prunus armeniaca]
MQSLGSTEPRVPKITPRTMLSDYKLTDESEVEEALNWYPALEWLAHSFDYGKYRDEYIRYRHYDELREVEGQHTTPEGANIRVGNISPQAYSVQIPSWALNNGSQLVCIPRGQDSAGLPLPNGVTHVTTQVATEILELNVGLNALLFSTSLEASIEIRRLRQEIILKNTKGTTIESEDIGQDVLDDDAVHEFRSKFKHDIVRKGNTKIVVPQEHEEDEEEDEEEEEEGEQEEEHEEEYEEEQEEQEEEQEEDDDEAWIQEDEVGDEDEEEDEDEDEDEDEAAAKGNADAEQHSTNQKRKGDKSVHSCTPKRKKTN